MRSFLTVLVFITIASCSNSDWKKVAVNTIAGAVSPAIAITFSCKNGAEVGNSVREELARWFDSNKIESNPKNKSVNSALCEAAVSAILPSIVSVANGQLPAQWDCSSEFVGESVVDLAKIACQAIK